jgi:hypothetical protein
MESMSHEKARRARKADSQDEQNWLNWFVLFIWFVSFDEKSRQLNNGLLLPAIIPAAD